MSTSNESVTVTGDVLAGNNTFGRNADGFKVVIPGGVVSGQSQCSEPHIHLMSFLLCCTHDYCTCYCRGFALLEWEDKM